MKHIGRSRLITGAAILVVIVGWVTVSKIRTAQANKPTIETAKVERGTVASSISASGVLQPLTTVDVKSNAGGQVELLAVDVGTIVEPGQLIAKIDPSDSRTAFNQAEADLSAANARMSQSKESLTLQKEQNVQQLQQATQAYEAAKARLAQAEAQAKVQPTLTKAAIRQADANYRSAQQSLRQLKEAGVPQGTAQAKSAYDSAMAAMDNAKRNLDRQQGLFDKGFISAGQLDSAKLSYDTAKANADSAKERYDTVAQDYDAQLQSAQARLDQAEAALDNAKANAIQDDLRKQDVAASRAALSQAATSLASAKSSAHQIPIRAADIRSSQASIVRSQAAVDNAKTQLNYTTITAPRAGVILQKYVEVGSIIQSGRSSVAGTGSGTSIVQLGDLSRMFVLASVDETDIASVEPGQSVDITLDAYPDELFEGVVTRIDPQTVSQQNVTVVPVTVEITDPDARLKPGMNATCSFVIDRQENVLIVPTEAVQDQDGKYSVTVIKGGKQTERRVEVGLTGDQNTEIVSGLKEGDMVVTSVIEAPGQDQGGGDRRSGVPGLSGGRHFH
ncbi:MAG TPA: efflux RND transporter periplasmic adaptor subunit [Armatimonadota bacterium]|nr:efflux RND transporter periplasmic adaptor subunit [Armatimonadota bacterium]